MARYTFGGSIYDIVVSEDLTNVGTETTPREALALDPAGTSVTLSTTPGGSAVTDFLLWDGAAFTIAASSITVDEDGYLPRFQGPDGVTTLYDASGHALPTHDASGGGGGTADWSTLAGKPAVIAAGPDEAAARAAIGATDYSDADAVAAVEADANIPTKAGNNDFTGTNTFAAGSISPDSIGNLDSRFDNYVASKGIPQVRTFAFGTTPTITPNTLWLEQASGATPVPAASLVLHQALTTSASTYVFTLSGALPAAAVYVAFVTGGLTTGTSGAPAPITTSISGRSLTWTTIGAGATTPAGVMSMRMLKGVGTPDASGNISVTFPSAMTGCHIEIIALSSVSATVVQNAYNAPTGALTAPTVNTPSSATSTNVQLLALAWNSASQTITTDPGTPFGTTPDVTSTGPTAATRASYRASAQTTNTWAKSGSSQYIAATVTFTPA